MKNPTKAELNEMTLKALAELHNKHADKPVKKFASKSSAVSRVMAVLPAEKTKAKKAPAKTKAPAKKAGKKAETKKTDGAGRGRPHTFGLTKITMITKPNPHREGTLVADRYDLLKKGMTADKYVEAVMTAFPGASARSNALADLRGDCETALIEMT